MLALIEDAVMEQVECGSLYAALESDPKISPRDALVSWATSYRDVCARHVPLVRIIALTPISGAPRTVEMYEVLARVLKQTGLPNSAIMPRIVALESFIYGSAYDVHAPEDIFDLPMDSEARAPALADARGAFLPAASAEKGAEESNPYADEPFRLGLEALLADLPEEKIG
ncbi:TetR/AcrR family transcriptional regulator C-terminal domain-containing protein [Corynebacterium guaraldiae]